MSRIPKISWLMHGEILTLIVSGRAATRAALVEQTALARGTLADRLGELLASSLVREGPEGSRSSGGRPAKVLELNADFAHVLTAEVGEHRTRVAVTDLAPRILAEEVIEFDVTRPPREALAIIASAFDRLLAAVDPSRPLLGLGINLSAPVDFGAGCVFGPSIMTGWDGFDIPAWFAGRFAAPAFVDNDVNLLALTEFCAHWRTANQFLFVKAGTGIGSGIMHNGELYRGARGASGDIGHIRLSGPDAPVCRCGKIGCLEAQASGWALARDLRADGFEAQDARDVMRLVEAGVPQAITLVNRAGMLFGQAAADLVSILNPDVLVIGGTLAKAGPLIMTGIAATVNGSCLPIATRTLKIATARSGDRAGTIGAAHLVIRARLCSKRLAGVLQDLHNPRRIEPVQTQLC